ncbi:hypothetical protein URH17368_0781 [Alicyclobacillus hesperidum URH17-3-68]|nr:hypothetical protein URH17368_0781 [Alicyclobacillus hesperidum URH17-3-68]
MQTMQMKNASRVGTRPAICTRLLMLSRNETEVAFPNG